MVGCIPSTIGEQWFFAVMMDRWRWKGAVCDADRASARARAEPWQRELW